MDKGEIMNNLNRIRNFIIRFLTEPEEMHVEAIVVDKIYKELISFQKKKSIPCFLMTPINYKFLKSQYFLKINKEKFSNLLEERYKELKKYTEVGLHVHLANNFAIDRMDYGDQLDKISKGKKFLEEKLDVEINMFAPGWWSYNMNTVKACKKLGITEFHIIKGQEKYNLEGVDFIEIYNNSHDFSLKNI